MEVLASRYEVIETIRQVQGRALLRALDRQLQLPVALKIVEPTAERSRADVLAETGVLRGVVSHAGIPKVFDDFFDGERYVIVMEWVDGVDLEQELSARGEPGLTLSTVVEYAGQAAAALDHLHRNDPPIVHGDVKPANLVRRKDGKIVLVDFGIARAAGTRSHEGTKGYVAPEVIAGAVAAPAQDVFSLAMTVLTLLTGRTPEESGSDLDAHVEREAIGRLALTLQLGLHMDPARRPTAAEFAERLRVDASSLPTGEVTFLAAELVGAGDLWERDAEAMEIASQRLDSILALAVDDCRGRVVASDPFRAVFTRSAAATAAALAIRQRVRDARWPSGLDIELRVALHTGEALVRNGNYVGASYAYLTRVLEHVALGTIVLSRTTAELTRNRLPEGARISAFTARDGTELFLLLGPDDDEPERETAPMARPTGMPVPVTGLPVASTDPTAIRRALVDRRFDALLEQQAMVTALKTAEALPVGPERSLEVERQRRRVIAASDLLDQAKAALDAHDATSATP